VRSELSQEIVHGVVGELLGALREVTTLVETLGIAHNLLHREDLNAELEDRHEAHVREFVPVHVIHRHQEHHQLDVSLDHLLDVQGIAFIRLFAFGQLRVFEKLSGMENIIGRTDLQHSCEMAEIRELSWALRLALCLNEQVHVVHIREEANHSLVTLDAFE